MCHYRGTHAFLWSLLLAISASEKIHEKCKIMPDFVMICKGVTETDQSQMGHKTITSAMYEQSPIALTASFMLKHPNIEELYVSHAISIESDTFKKSPQLQTVYLVNSNLGNIPVELLKDTNITSFDLTGSSFNVPEGPLLISETLQFLTLGRVKIGCLNQFSFINLPRLWEMNAPFNKFESMPDKLFANNSHLIRVNLNSNNFEYGFPETFKGMTDSVEVTFHDNKFNCNDDRTKEMIQVLKKLKAFVQGSCAIPKNMILEDAAE